MVLNGVAGHHGTIPFECVEAEIVANADCYRFIHPVGVFHYLGTLSKRDLSAMQIISTAETKLDEKFGVLSLKRVKDELIPHYERFKLQFREARRMLE